MLSEKSKKIIEKEMQDLPKEAREAIGASGWEKITEEIGRKYLLDAGEIETFQLETASFLLGLLDEEGYAQNIEDEVGTSKDEAEKIGKEVEQKIFIPIYDKLTEGIKKSDKVKNPKWDQNINFILSGGDYGSFLEQREKETPSASPLSGGVPQRPKITDIKSKFTI